jgi:hypothetical protein
MSREPVLGIVGVVILKVTNWIPALLVANFPDSLPLGEFDDSPLVESIKGYQYGLRFQYIFFWELGTFWKTKRWVVEIRNRGLFCQSQVWKCFCSLDRC